MMKLSGTDNRCLANSKRLVGKLFGPQARKDPSALIRSPISECVVGRRYMLYDVGSVRKPVNDLFDIGIFSSRDFPTDEK